MTIQPHTGPNSIPAATQPLPAPEPVNAPVVRDLTLGEFEQYMQVRAAFDALKEMEARYQRLLSEFQATIGDATSVRANGRELATHNPVCKHRTADFQKEHPDVYRRFRRVEQVEREVMDWAELAAVYPTLEAQYRSRSWKWKDITK